MLLICASLISGITISYGKWFISVPVFLVLSLILVYYEYSIRTRIISLIVNNKFLKRKAFIKAMFAGIILILAVGVSLIGSAYLNQRIASISFGSTELQERFAYYKDAISIIKDYPLFGTASGGWSSIQFKYQTALHSVKYVHSSIFQTVLDYGIAGLLVFISQIIVLIIYAIKIFRNNCGKKLKYAMALAVVCNSAILLHSAIDFDFEFSTTAMIFWINMAFLSGASGNVRSINFHKGDRIHKEPQKVALTIRIGFSSVIVLVMLCLLSLYTSDFFYSKGVSQYNSKNYLKAEVSLENAVRFNPFSSNSYYARSKSVSSQLKDRYSGKLQKGIEYLLTAEKYDPFKPAYAESLADIYDNLNDYRKSTEEYGKLTKLSPMKIDYYEGLSESLMAMAETDFGSGREDAAKNKCKKIVRIPQQLEKTGSRISANAGKLKHKLVLKITPELAYNIVRAYLYLNDNQKAIEYLRIASKGKNIPKSWLLKQYTLRKGTS
jgi:tetratricopeptide (TPR) repeat protein